MLDLLNCAGLFSSRAAAARGICNFSTSLLQQNLYSTPLYVLPFFLKKNQLYYNTNNSCTSQNLLQ
jgi:hypothetical protein